MIDSKPLVGLDRELVEFWDEFHFVGNSYDDRTIWAVGMYCGDIIVSEGMYCGDIIVSEVNQPQLLRDLLMLFFILNAFCLLEKE